MNGFEQATLNHEYHHYNTFAEAVRIIKDGLKLAEKKKFDTRAEAQAYGETIRERANNIYAAAEAHSARYDVETDLEPKSFLQPTQEKFAATFDITP